MLSRWFIISLICKFHSMPVGVPRSATIPIPNPTRNPNLEPDPNPLLTLYQTLILTPTKTHPWPNSSWKGTDFVQTIRWHILWTLRYLSESLQLQNLEELKMGNTPAYQPGSFEAETKQMSALHKRVLQEWWDGEACQEKPF